jgi:hypothetical protein
MLVDAGGFEVVADPVPTSLFNPGLLGAVEVVGGTAMVVMPPPGASTTIPLDPKLATWLPGSVIAEPPIFSVCPPITATEDAIACTDIVCPSYTASD